MYIQYCILYINSKIIEPNGRFFVAMFWFPEGSCVWRNEMIDMVEVVVACYWAYNSHQYCTWIVHLSNPVASSLPNRQSREGVWWQKPIHLPPFTSQVAQLCRYQVWPTCIIKFQWPLRVVPPTLEVHAFPSPRTVSSPCRSRKQHQAYPRSCGPWWAPGCLRSWCPVGPSCRPRRGGRCWKSWRKAAELQMFAKTPWKSRFPVLDMIYFHGGFSTSMLV